MRILNLKKGFCGLAVLASLAFAFSDEGDVDFSLGGYFRSGFQANFNGENLSNGKKTVTFNATNFNDGNYYGNGNSRLRLNLDVEGQSLGFASRFQMDDWEFGAENVAWIMGYGKFCKDILVAEAGKMVDLFTGSDGWEEYDLITGTYGIGLAALPIEGLALQVAMSLNEFSDYNTTDLWKDYALISANAKYTHKAFKIAGGFEFLNFSAFAYFSLTCFEPLGLDIDFWRDKEHFAFTEDFNYQINEKFGLGLLMNQTFYDSSENKANELMFNPHLKFAFNDLYALSAEATMTILVGSNAPSKNFSFNVTPAFWVTPGSGKASANLFYTFESDAGKIKNLLGLGARIDF